jgi:S-(hydroxymethyl)glutathione dehydrogenase / alcohol dehydrogenase
MKAVVVNAIGRGFDSEDVDIATPIGHEILVNVQAPGLCHTDLLFAAHDFVPTTAGLGHEVPGIVSAVGPAVALIPVGDHVGACAGSLSGRPFHRRHPASTHCADRPKRPPRSRWDRFVSRRGLGGFAEAALRYRLGVG